MRKTKKFLLTILTALCCICALFAGSFGINVSERKAFATTATLKLDLKSVYYLGDSLEVPETVEIDVAGTSITGSNAKLIMPDGVVCGSGTYTLSKKGTYTVIYYGKNGEKSLSASKSFVVSGYNWETNGSETTYGELTRGKGEGVIVDLADGDVFRLNTIKDISGLSELDVCRINPDIREAKTGTPTAALVIMRVVDAFNPDIFVEFYLWAQSTGLFYMGCGASNQPLVGLEPKDTGTLYNGQIYKVHKMTRYATSGVYGRWVNGLETSQALANAGGMAYTWDFSTNQVYFKSGNTLINDLDAPEIYSENIFTGFSSNYVYAEVQCYGYSKSSINIEIQSLLGFTGEDLMKKPSEDNIAPILTVDTELTDENGVYVVKGKEYAIPQNVSVMDVNYNGTLTKKVYYNYGSAEEVEIYVENGKFTPTLLGRYTVEYKAKDSYGNEGIFTLPLNVVEADDTILYTEEKLNQMYVAEKVRLPKMEATGVNKEVQVKVSVTNPKGQTQVLDERNEYTVEYVGTHTITYTFTDNVYSKTFSYTVNAEDNGLALFNGTPKLPAYFIKDATYIFEEYVAYTFGMEGLEPNKTTMQISVDGGEFSDVNMIQPYKVAATDTLRIKYIYKEQETEVFTVPVVDLGYGGTRSYDKYFQGTYDSVTSNPLAISYFFDGTESEGKMTFVNTLSLENFYFGFGTAEGQDNFDVLTLTLTDYSNADNKISISFQNLVEAEEMIYSVKQWENQQLVVEYSSKIESKMSTTSLAVFQKEGRLTNNIGASPVAIKKFENDLAILTINVSGIDGESRLDVKTINNQTISSRIREQAPQIKYFAAEGIFEVGDSFLIKPAIISNVFNIALKTDIKMTVTVPTTDDKEPQVALSKDGKKLENVNGCDTYVVALTEPGNYRVSYTYSCQTKDGLKTEDVSFIISVVDTTAPTLSFKDGLNEQSLIKVKVGFSYRLPKYIMSDNDTAFDALRHGINIHNATGIVVANNVETFVFRKAGYYTVRAWCMDEYGNMTSRYYNVLAE
ncbi:MAG: hypothetical protein IJ506_08720 [Clostridia bacterium]|nr:hypothetical protein [Clostridia bacterium]